MSASMDESRLAELAARMKALLDEYEIEAEKFTVGILVTAKYYRSIKANFSDRHEVDMIVGVNSADCSINLICSPFERPDET